jgi:cyclic beta-1,2-glucan synthetase
MRGGDWNDGMNRVGHGGEGESIWLAWFLAKTVTEFAELARQRGDRERVTWCTERVARLAQAVEKHGWDGQWYRRAYFDDGTPLGSRQNSECTIDAIAQSWAVIAGIGDPQRAKQALRSSEERLISARHKLMQLLDPPFQQTVPDPGYIQAYPPGIRENGGQYTHGVLWTVLALTLEGEGDRAAALFSHLNPIRHGDTPDAVAVYRVEPYVVAADVYGASEHAGRGGWTWYTGSAGWMYRITLENILGVRRNGHTLSFVPCIPSSWNSFEIDYGYGSSRYHIVMQNPDNVCQGVVTVELDGRAVSNGMIKLESDGQTHEVRVTLGTPQVARLARAGSVRHGGS